MPVRTSRQVIKQSLEHDMPNYFVSVDIRTPNDGYCRIGKSVDALTYDDAVDIIGRELVRMKASMIDYHNLDANDVKINIVSCIQKASIK